MSDSICHGEKAKQYFQDGFTCSQAVVAAFADEPYFKKTSLDFDTAMKLASSFGGGMGRLREVCGAVSAMFMIEGLLQGFKSPDKENTNHSTEKKEHYERIQELAAQFKKENGSIICRELLGLSDKPCDNKIVSTDPFSAKPEERSKEYYKKRPCGDLCYCAAEILAKFLTEQGL